MLTAAPTVKVQGLVEEVIFRRLLVMGLALLREFLARAGDSTMGPMLTLPGDAPSEPPQVVPRLDASRSRPYLAKTEQSGAPPRSGRARWWSEVRVPGGAITCPLMR
jgi:hypothetical protein